MDHEDFVELTVDDAQGIAAIAASKEDLLEYAKALRKFINDLILDRVRVVDGGDPNCPQVPPPPPPQ